jgi:hypothetical protein
MASEKTCAYCGGPAEGNYSIHRDGFGDRSQCNARLLKKENGR